MQRFPDCWADGCTGYNWVVFEVEQVGIVKLVVELVP